MATLFTKIFKGEIPAKFIYQDDLCGVIHDLQPQAPKHFLIIPRKEIVSVDHASADDEKLLGHMVLVAAKIAKQEGLSNGYRLVINTGQDGGQSVDHLHIHLLGGRPMQWPPG
jgi:histidine triad (HIT) family protein